MTTMYGYSQTSKTDNERYLERRVEELEDQIRQDRREQEQARQERMEEYRRQGEANNHTATGWVETLQKQGYLFGREAAYDPDYPDNYFGPGAEACTRALVIWQEVETEKQSEIAELEARIKAIKDGIRLEVADKLETEVKGQGWQGVVNALREYDEDSCSIWLDW